MTDRMRFVGPHDLLLYLKSLPALAGASASELTLVAQNTRERFFRRGSLLLREGRRVQSFYLVVEGRVRVTGQGRQYGVAGPGERVGLLSFLAGEETGIDAVAETDVLALEFDAELVYGLFEDNFAVLLRDLRGICFQLLEALRALPGDLGLPPMFPGNLKCPTRPLDLVERLVLLRQSQPFQRSSLDALTELARQMVEVRFTTGTPLWKQGDPADFLYLIVCGGADCVGDGGRQRFVLSAGMPLGAVEALSGRPRWYDATAREEMVALRGETELLFDLLEDHFEMAISFMSMMARNLIAVLGSGTSALLQPTAPPALPPTAAAAAARHART